MGLSGANVTINEAVLAILPWSATHMFADQTLRDEMAKRTGRVVGITQERGRGMAACSPEPRKPRPSASSKPSSPISSERPGWRVGAYVRAPLVLVAPAGCAVTACCACVTAAESALPAVPAS